MINYLFSGIDKEKGFNSEQKKYLKKDIKNNSNITFIASAFDEYDKNKLFKEKIISFFSDIEIKFNNSNLIDNSISKETAKKILIDSDIVFLMGGDTKKQMESINEYNLINYIKSVPMIIGVSAGSINQTKNVVFLDEYENNKIVKYSGLGLIDINMYPHLDFTNVSYLKEIFLVSNYVPLIALPNESFIRIENSKIEYVGEHYFIKDNNIDMEGYHYSEVNHTGTINLESERLIYRKTTKEDIDEFFYIQLNPKLRKYLGTTKLGNNLEKNRQYFDEAKYNELNYYRWTIVKKEDNKLLGCIYLNIHDERAKTAGIDYWIREDEWENGYTTEASEVILRFAFETLDLNRIESCGAKENPGTWKVMEKIGLKYEGIRKQGLFYYYGGVQDIVMYGLTKEEYLKNKEKQKTKNL